MPNIPLLRKTFEHIEAHPEEWNQGVWGSRWQSDSACGTSFCFAGTAASINGNKIRWQSEGYDPRQSHIATIEVNEFPMHPKFAAQQILDIGGHEADVLFNSGNDLVDIKDILFHITDGELGECFRTTERGQDMAEDLDTDYWCFDNVLNG